MAQINPFEQQAPIHGVKKIIAVSSGKGGVGKSTVAANIALALKEKYKVGLLDADIYGPSQTRLMGALHQKPEISKDQKLIPIERYGIKIMSMGFLIEEDSAVVWRGPMLFKAMDQFLRDVVWGDLDFLIVDLPPGTGDVQLSLAQKVPITGAVVVSTPQNLAFIDVKKAIDMWKKLNIPVLGVIENMSFMVGTNSEKIQLFPKGEMDSYLLSKRISKIGEISFNPNLALACEAGIPLSESYPTAPENQEFQKIALHIAKETLGPAEQNIDTSP